MLLRVASSAATSKSIRGGQAGFVADSAGNLFPGSISDRRALCQTMNDNGVKLKGSASAQGFQNTFAYQTLDSDGDTTPDDYYFHFRVVGVPNTLTGSGIEVRPSGIMN
jgi:hypothetical protein